MSLPQQIAWNRQTAGNCNDLDLTQALNRFAAVRLVDWDRTAVLDGIRRQGCEMGRRLGVDAPVDLQDPPPPTETADVVLSAGLLSQLVWAAIHTPAGERPSMVASVAAEVRLRHLQYVSRRLRPGGHALVSFEIVSSETLPELAELAELAVRIAAAVRRGNFFVGMHPQAVFNTAQRLVRSGHAAHLRRYPPWRWSLGPRHYAVTALSFGRGENPLY